jgi:hypothetical protein
MADSRLKSWSRVMADGAMSNGVERLGLLFAD